MTVSPGDRLGPYEILSFIGKGGMGEVYQARDTRLDRTVAIKIIAAARIGDPQSRQRFEREARAVAALNHPHICHLHDVGCHDQVDFLVMEYLRGETLAGRLTKAGSGLPVDEALRHAIAIAEALDAAHQQGIVHRDLKPGNIMLTSAGVKLLDFGLAKLSGASNDAPAGLSTLSFTRKDPLTSEGSVLGTWPYLAPEQLEGRAVDARADIFAFGAVLYEMATGRRAFEADSRASLIVAILEREPVPLSHHRETPASLERVVRKCLQKPPEARWQSARDLGDALKWIVEERSLSSQPGARHDENRRRSSRWGWITAATTALAVGLGLGALITGKLSQFVTPLASVVRFTIQPPPAARMTNWEFALSPDGRSLVYEKLNDALYLRSLDQRDSRPIPGTEGGYYPTFSPDSQWIAFFVGDTLKKVSRTSGAPPVTLAEFPGLIAHSIGWLPDNSIVLGRVGVGLFRVSADGGTPIRLNPPDAAEGVIDHHTPRALPGTNALLITRHRGPETWDVATLNPETGDTHLIFEDAFDARYAASGHLVFARGQTLVAAPFDLRRLALTGPPVVIVDAIHTVANDGSAAYAVSDDGVLAYVSAIARDGRRLAWLGPNGAVDPLPVDPRAFWRPTLSPDGGRVAVEISEGPRRDIWILDVHSAALSRLTSDGASVSPIWTPDGTRVTFSRINDRRREVYWQPVDGTAQPERLVTDTFSVFAASWSLDGQRLAFIRQPPTDQTDIGLFNLAARTTSMTIAGERSEQQARFSPDGRWLAYATSETGRAEVVVASMDGTVRRTISLNGGIAPVWRPDGRTLFYRFGSGNRNIMAVDVSKFPTMIGNPSVVIKDGPFAFNVGGFGHPGYDVAADGRLLIVLAAPQETEFLRVEVVLNWFEEVKQRVPVP